MRRINNTTTDADSDIALALLFAPRHFGGHAAPDRDAAPHRRGVTIALTQTAIRSDA